MRNQRVTRRRVASSR